MNLICLFWTQENNNLMIEKWFNWRWYWTKQNKTSHRAANLQQLAAWPTLILLRASRHLRPRQNCLRHHHSCHHPPRHHQHQYFVRKPWKQIIVTMIHSNIYWHSPIDKDASTARVDNRSYAITWDGDGLTTTCADGVHPLYLICLCNVYVYILLCQDQSQ